MATRRYSKLGLGSPTKHNHGIALTFARTETKLFFETVWQRASAILFIKDRLYFHHVDGKRADASAGAPSVLVSYGDSDAQVLRDCKLPGQFVTWNKA